MSKLRDLLGSILGIKLGTKLDKSPRWDLGVKLRIILGIELG